MTDKQRKFFYFPAWRRACHANDWSMVKGRFVGKRAEQHGVPDVNALYQAVWDCAEKLALQDHTAMTLDHLRHGAHMVAIGQDKSANDLRNTEVDKVVNLFKLLTEPDDVSAVLGLQHPENSERKRIVHSIYSRAPEARVIAIAKNLKRWAGEWESPFWEDMPIEGLRTLDRIIRNEQRRWNDPAPVPEHSVEETNPF